MQESAFTTAAPFSMVIAPTGQAPSQAPQPTHASETLCAIINSPFYLRADVIMKKRTLARPRTPPGICILVCILTKRAGKGKTNRKRPAPKGDFLLGCTKAQANLWPNLQEFFGKNHEEQLVLAD
jgi:hypothetical protein